MLQPTSSTRKQLPAHLSLDEIVEAFEIARNGDGQADLRQFLPGTNHPKFRAIATELLRIDLEQRWRRGERPTAGDYRRNYPDLLDDPRCLERVAFEEYRQRHASGLDALPSDYAAQLHVDTRRWPEFGSTHVSHVGAAPDSDDSAFPPEHAVADGPVAAAIGRTFHGFQIVEHLGSGRFGQVYLARQTDLADRHVVIKITTIRWSDSDRLARLQHTNVVPIHSVHSHDDLQVVCMPFFGRNTLEDVLQRLSDPVRATAQEFLAFYLDPRDSSDHDRAGSTHLSLRDELARMSYERLALWIVAQLADGLAHAHQRGILHRDLKPANILMGASGQPLILDFNLSDDFHPGARRSHYVGGTLPYMAGEHLAAVLGNGQVDGRGDIFSLGVILYQLLTGRLPYRSIGRDKPEDLVELMQRRQRPAPSVRQFRPQTSPAVASIVKRCLAPSPADRYQSVRQLQIDLQRQLADQPLFYAPDRSPTERLCKWIRRHPRLSSAGSLAAMAAGLLAVTVGMILWRGEQIARLRARENLRQFSTQAQGAQMVLSVPDQRLGRRNSALQMAQAALEPYQLNSPDWRRQSSWEDLDDRDRQRLQRQLRKLLYLTASEMLAAAQRDTSRTPVKSSLETALHYNTVAGQLLETGRLSPALLQQRSDLLRALQRPRDADRVDAERMNLGDQEEDESFFQIVGDLRSGNYPAALAALDVRRAAEPLDLQAWFLSGSCNVGLGRWDAAEIQFTRCLALKPDAFPAYFQRGLVRFLLQDWVGAESDFSEVLRLYPEQPDVHFNRAAARRKQGKYSEAVEDYTAMIQLGRNDALPYLLRSQAYRQLGMKGLADQDLTDGLQRDAVDANGWIQRALALWPTDPERAVDDLDTALQLEPESQQALQNRVLILAQGLGRDAEAIETLDRWIALVPNAPNAYAMRGLLLARRGHREQAIADVERLMALGDRAHASFQAACILAQCSRSTPSDADRAVQLLRQAVSTDLDYADKAISESALQSLVQREDVQQLLGVARWLRSNATSAEKSD